ncbi:hypothetical protein VNO78_03486 [Psophocarpus tetragonolobus]|uniref:Uncharacterized protein n=1 Tax=Psophocarpus tetragonolobus TaxID=3891 RepID=A0AAN9TE61_PSOTE
MLSTFGDALVDPYVLPGFKDELLPITNIVTQNIKDASALLGGLPLHSILDMHIDAKLIHDLGPRFLPLHILSTRVISTVEQYTLLAAHAFRSAWMPAPPPESDPATLTTCGLSIN